MEVRTGGKLGHSQHSRQPSHRQTDAVLPGITFSLTLKSRSPGGCRGSLLHFVDRSVSLASSAQAETGEAEPQQRERAGFGDGIAYPPAGDPYTTVVVPPSTMT